jgi:preprotein translocase subunit YajC
VGYNLIFIVILIAAFWALLVRPQRRRAQEQRELHDNLEPGDEIVTAGGLYGIVRSVDGEELHVEVAEGVTVRLARRAVAGIVERDEEPEAAEEEPEQTQTGHIEQIHDESPNPS